MQSGREAAGSAAYNDDVVIHSKRLSVGTGPGFEFPAFALAILIEREISDGLIRNKFLFCRVVDGQIEIGVPGAGVDIQLALVMGWFAMCIQRDDLMMMCMAV